jgi:hypothetical protein
VLGAAASAVTWPIVESYLSAGRHGAEMRAAIGWFNVTWTPATATALLLMPIVSRAGMLATLSLSAAGSGAAMLATLRAADAPGCTRAGGRAGGGRARIQLPRARGVVAACR